MKTLKELNYLLDAKMKARVFMLFVMVLIGSAVELLGVAIVLPIVNLAMETESIDSSKYAKIITLVTGATEKNSILLWLIGLTIVIYILKDIYLVAMNRQLYKFSADIKRQMATRLMKAYLKQSYSYFLKSNTSDLIRSVNSDTSQLYEIVVNILQVASNGITALCLVIFLSITNFWMTLVVALLLATCALLLVFVLQKRLRKMGRRNQVLSGFMIRYLQETFEGVKEIKLLNNENHFIEQYNKGYKEASEISIKSSTFGIIPKYMIEVVCITGILGYLGINVIFNPNYMELMPQLAVFCVAAYKLLPSVNALNGYINTIIFHRASIELVYNDIKEADKMEESFENNNSDTEEFVFNDVIKLTDASFKYDGAEKNVFSDGNLEIKKGQSVAFIGASGGGKTTTADIILSLLTPTKGKVTVDGMDISENIWGWRKKIGYIPQTIYLIDDSIRKNVAFGISDEDIDDEEVWRALKDAQLYDFVKSLPEGLDTAVGERGTRISGGQRQRIGIARALYRNPEVLVFDEATSALDNETEKEVMKAIDGLQGTKTMIMIAHRLTTIENCDVVYRIEDGKIVKDK